MTGDHDRAIADYTKAVQIDSMFAEAHIGRATAYYNKGEYDKAWGDVRRAQRLGLQVPPEFLKALRETSGKEQ